MIRAQRPPTAPVRAKGKPQGPPARPRVPKYPAVLQVGEVFEFIDQPGKRYEVLRSNEGSALVKSLTRESRTITVATEKVKGPRGGTYTVDLDEPKVIEIESAGKPFTISVRSVVKRV